jgi:peptidyl-dipeptidase Dcp
MTSAVTDRSTNPLLSRWDTPFGVPPFGAIATADFAPAFVAAMERHETELAAIRSNPDAPTFENTIVAMERAGSDLRRVGGVFWNLASSLGDDAMRAVEREMSPRLAKHWSGIMLDDGLFRRVDALHARRGELGLPPQALRTLERYHLQFVRAGAGRPEADKARLAQIAQELATLGTVFGQNVLADEEGWFLALKPEDLSGLPSFLVDAMAEAARQHGVEGHAVTLSRSIVEPFLTFSPRRDLREAAWRAWTTRGEHEGPHDNRPIMTRILALRGERARIIGYPTFAHYKLADSMAATPEAVRELLERVWSAGKARAGREAADLASVARREGHDGAIAPWDWRYLAEKVRVERHAFDEAQLKAYLTLDGVIAAAFHVAGELFGLRFAERADVPVYHRDVRAFEVTDADGRHVGLFLGDYFARSGKRSGAWMSAFRNQDRLDGDARPIIVNVMNFAKAPEGKATLLSFDDARTLFHEFGHALHGLLSDVDFPLLAGTNVARDFVELPSQLYEHWLEQKQVLSRFARHVETGEPMPQALIDKLKAARNFNQGHATVEYTGSALVDLDLHLMERSEAIDALAVEREVLVRIGMPPEIGMRHRTPHFAHVFSGDGYASGYYSYLWSEVMDADAFAAFREAGDIFHRDTAARLREHVYGAGNRVTPGEAYIAFRGRLPSVEPLLEKRGLVRAD